MDEVELPASILCSCIIERFPLEWELSLLVSSISSNVCCNCKSQWFVVSEYCKLSTFEKMLKMTDSLICCQQFSTKCAVAVYMVYDSIIFSRTVKFADDTKLCARVDKDEDVKKPREPNKTSSMGGRLTDEVQRRQMLYDAYGN
ncbi:hypothetical protein HELRODRAFT_171427 [Helobdella robusta]|uniref:Uncharacterized protein n=1 Tax=Helobdella robusta TaxID=6412 RepID=T1F495_HELRO|nr:hypothetical protein HELRODRAFT_171427 [Helobdella robusta]ESO05758.1 hypothetical protein HELRODRAFT_171427 [Helobdella robusta]